MVMSGGCYRTHIPIIQLDGV